MLPSPLHSTPVLICLYRWKEGGKQGLWPSWLKPKQIIPYLGISGITEAA